MPLSQEEAERILPQAINTQENCQKLVDAGANAGGVGNCLAEISRANPALITQENFQALIDAGANAKGVHQGLMKIGSVNPALITQENFQALIDAGANAYSIGFGLAQLGRVNPSLITQENRQALTDAGANGFSIGVGLAELGWANPAFITQENRQALIDAGANAQHIGRSLGEIGRANPALITQENIQALIDADANAHRIGVGLAAIVRANPALITQGNFQALIDAGDNAGSVSMALIELGQTNYNLVTQDNLNALLNQGENALNCAREIIRRAAPMQEQQALPVGDRQSTHIASVHKSASESAKRLMTSYCEQIQGENLETTLQEIRNWAQGMPDNQQSVKDCVTRLTAPGFTYEDPGSHVSMHQLLALTWKSLHDNDKREGDLNNGLDLFAQGLVEIQNEYGPGSPACTGGTFNKVIEKLVGIHPDAELLVITSAQAAAKLPVVVKEEAYKYLYSLASPETKEGLKAFTDLLEKLKAEGIDVIWSNIKDSVADRMINEFGSIYNNSKDDTGFQGLLSSGKYVYLDGLDKFQKQISESKGYNEFMKSVIRQSNIPAQQSPPEPGTKPDGHKPGGKK